MKLISILALLLTMNVQAAPLKSQIYGYVEGYLEKVEKSPTRTGGTSTTEGTHSRTENPHEFDTPHINFMVKSSKGSKYSSFLNLDASGSSVSMKNGWFDASLHNDLLRFRIGKIYRRFGLYNEILDAVPTYMGIEPPELFDGDHLLLTRTTNFMLHGETSIGGDTLRYSLTTGNDERFNKEVPIGGDVRYTKYGNSYELTVGSSFYFSDKAKPSVAVGSGSPNGGVLNWMNSDRYKVLGAFTELIKGGTKLQFAYFVADHDAKRSGSKLQSLSTAALNNRQIQRLCNGNMSTCSDSGVNYKVKTWYIRAGHTFNTSMGDFTPYVQWDFYDNPETVATKSNGGDNEAGVADDGKFKKQTLGVVYQPDLSLIHI